MSSERSATNAKRGLFDLTNRIVVVTGGLGQLGSEFARTLIELGARVAVLDLDVSPARIRRSFPDQSERLLCFRADVRKHSEIQAALVEIQRIWGVPHGLINSAALDSPPDAPATENGPFEDYPAASLEEVLAVNVGGTVAPSQVFGAAMARAGRGSIINISSIYGIVSPDQRVYEYRRQAGEAFYKPVSYSVSKSAILNLTRYMATYWATSGVRVNTVTFGGVRNAQDEAFVQEYTRRVPLQRMAEAHEYNGVIVFLLSEASSYVTGSNIVVDGGWTAW